MAIAPQDLFSANQIIHLRPITGHRMFERFVTQNGFVRGFYPNFEIGPQPAAIRRSASTLARAGALVWIGADCRTSLTHVVRLASATKSGDLAVARSGDGSRPSA